MSEFVYKIDILSESQVEYFKELTNKHYKDFVKVIVNEDPDVFELFVDNLLSELAIGDINTKGMSSLEKLYLMIVLRAYNISPTVSFSCDTDEETDDGKTVKLNINIDVIQLAQKIERLT